MHLKKFKKFCKPITVIGNYLLLLIGLRAVNKIIFFSLIVSGSKRFLMVLKIILTHYRIFPVSRQFLSQ